MKRKSKIVLTCFTLLCVCTGLTSCGKETVDVPADADTSISKEVTTAVLTDSQSSDDNSDSINSISRPLDKISKKDYIMDYSDSEVNLETGYLYEASFERVTDDNIYIINIEGADFGGQIRAKLIGVDMPEDAKPSTYGTNNTEAGKKVCEITKEKFHKGDKMFVEFDKIMTDTQNRHLCYVYYYETPEDEANEEMTFVQDWLLVNGYAKTLNKKPNEKYKEHFQEISDWASENHIGLWNGYYGDKVYDDMNETTTISE